MTVRIAAVGDIHVGRDTGGRVADGLRSVDDRADMLLLAGDLTMVGSPDEARCVAAELAHIHVPIVAVLGNHDVHSDREDEVVAVLREAGIVVLDGTSVSIRVRGIEVGIAGSKGFCGGFLGRSAGAFGERIMREFVGHAVAAANELAGALADLRTDVRLALLHYSPVPDTLVGEPLEIYPFLGSYLLAEAIDRARPDLVIHGHAHRGTEFGVTAGGVRVRNVAQPAIRSPFKIYELSPRDPLDVPARPSAHRDQHQVAQAGSLGSGTSSARSSST